MTQPEHLSVKENPVPEQTSRPKQGERKHQDQDPLTDDAGDSQSGAVDETDDVIESPPDRQSGTPKKR